MKCTIRQLGSNEIPSIGQIDNSDRVDARYVVSLQPDGMGLSLLRKSLDPPEQEPSWGEKELASRYALWKRNHDEEGAVFYGAFIGDKLVGMSAVVRLPDCRTGELYALHVDKKHRRRGIGSALLAESENQCTIWSCNLLILYTGFKASSLDFYRAKGYDIVGIQNPNMKTKNFDLTMAKKLQDRTTVST